MFQYLSNGKNYVYIHIVLRSLFIEKYSTKNYSKIVVRILKIKDKCSYVLTFTYSITVYSITLHSKLILKKRYSLLSKINEKVEFKY